MTPAVISVLTRGLSCGNSAANEGGTLISAGIFTLWCDYAVEPPEPVPVGAGGGGAAHPNGLSGNIARNTTPILDTPIVTPDLVYIDPKKVMGRRVPVTLTFNMGKTKVEKIYTVPVSKVEVAIKVVNIISSSKKKFNIGVVNIRKKVGKLSIAYKAGRSFISKRRDYD